MISFRVSTHYAKAFVALLLIEVCRNITIYELYPYCFVAKIVIFTDISSTMSDIHRQIEAGVALTVSVAGRARQYMEEEEMEVAANRLKKVMEDYIKLENEWREGSKVLGDMRRRLGKVGGGDWPDVEEEYKKLVKSNKQKLVLEKHGWWKELHKALESKDVENNIVEGGENDELEMTQLEINTMCPISRKEMVKPVKNMICGHVYDKHSIYSLLQQNPMCRCPMVGCPSKRAVEKRNLVEDKETKEAINNKK